MDCCQAVTSCFQGPYATAGARALVRAREYQKRSRRKMWIILGVVFAVILIVALIIMGGFMP